MPTARFKNSFALNALGDRKTKLYEKINALDSELYEVVLDLVRYGRHPKGRSVHFRIGYIMGKKAKLEEKVLKIDIAMCEMAKKVLGESI